MNLCVYCRNSFQMYLLDENIDLFMMYVNSTLGNRNT